MRLWQVQVGEQLCGNGGKHAGPTCRSGCDWTCRVGRLCEGGSQLERGCALLGVRGKKKLGLRGSRPAGVLGVQLLVPCKEKVTCMGLGAFGAACHRGELGAREKKAELAGPDLLVRSVWALFGL